MSDIDLTLRTELARPMNVGEFDGNWTILQAIVNVLQVLKVDITDPRLSDTRTPKAHGHPMSDIAGISEVLAAKADATSVTTLSELLANLQDVLADFEIPTQVRSGLGPPSDGVGNVGDVYFDVTSGIRVMYGPKQAADVDHEDPYWPVPGFVLVAPGDGSFQIISLADLRAAAEAGTLSENVQYRLLSSDQQAIVLEDSTVPNLVQTSGPTSRTKLLVDEAFGGLLDSAAPTWDYVISATLE